ncbi:hypothetical protein EDD15DRAFT_2380028 [Pisolithus albus]|nr:hypothetical protein EDD15DRAFT_2380028 [Pisolithus albus]
MIILKYMQISVLTIIHDSKTILLSLKCDLSINDDSIFYKWLEEEKEYLEGLSHEPPEETLHMEYWQGLRKFESRLHMILDTWNAFEPAGATSYSGDMRENYNKDVLVMQELERKLNISQHWVPEDKEWQNAGHLVANREYCCTLDNLESLVVAWLFELTKMNRAGTGYKLWKHVAKALQTRSAAIKTLQWEEVVEYTFLANFNLLWDTDEDILQHPWVHPTAHFALDTFFKMCQAEEEIARLNIEIR